MSEKQEVVLEVNGSGNHIVGVLNGDLVYQAPARPKVKVIVQPGPEHVSDSQKATLKDLVNDIVKAEAVRRKPKTHASVWAALNAKFRTTSYHLIRAEDYARAETWLRQWVGRLSSMKSAPAKLPDWRKRKYSYIHTNVRNLAAEPALRAMLLRSYGVDTLIALTDDQLAAAYQVVAGWKRDGRVPSGKA